MIINDDSNVISKGLKSLNDDTRVIIYDRNMFIIQATVYIHYFYYETIIFRVVPSLYQLLYTN
jgi:hypothetical protein